MRPKRICHFSQELDAGSYVDLVTGRHSPLPPCSAGQTVVVSSNADRDFFYGACVPGAVNFILPKHKEIARRAALRAIE